MIPLIVALILTDILAFLFLGLEFHFLKEWYLHRGTVYAEQCLIWAIAILSYFGVVKSIILLLFRSEESCEDEPKILKSFKAERLKRPDGSEIHIEHFGIPGNPAIIFIHGWNSNRLQWYYQIQHFKKDHHLILIDLAGLGESRGPENQDYSLEKLAADLDAVIQKTELKNPLLWGHSIGGMCILTYCKLFPEKLRGIRGLILQHTTYTNPLRTIIFSSILSALEKPLLKPLCRLMIFLSPLLSLVNWFRYYTGSLLILTRLLVFGGTQSSRQLNYITRLSAMASPAVVARGVLGMFNYDASDSVALIQTPTLIIAGDRDILTKYGASVEIHKRIEKSVLVNLVPSGHMGLIERHQTVNLEAERFISRADEMVINQKGKKAYVS